MFYVTSALRRRVQTSMALRLVLAAAFLSFVHTILAAGVRLVVQDEVSYYVALGGIAAALFGVGAFMVGKRIEVLKDRGHTDPLTGIGNRRLVESRLVEEFARCARAGRPISVLLIDVDRLKEINDHFGHHGGDAVLRLVADTLIRCTRLSDVVGRYGGDEYLVVAPETDSVVGAALARRIRSELQRSRTALPRTLEGVTLSIGVATSGPSTVDAPSLIRVADEAMYESKNCGGDRHTSVNAPRTAGVSHLKTPAHPTGRAG